MLSEQRSVPTIGWHTFFYLHQPFVGSLGSHPHWCWSFCPVSCGGEGAEGRQAAPAPPSKPWLLLSAAKAGGSTGQIIMPESMLMSHVYWIHQTLLSHRASHEPFISLETADWSSFIFCKSPVKYLSIKVLQELGFLQGQGSLPSLCSATLPSALGFPFVPGTAAFQFAGCILVGGVVMRVHHSIPRFPMLLKPQITPKAEAAALQPRWFPGALSTAWGLHTGIAVLQN